MPKDASARAKGTFAEPVGANLAKGGRIEADARARLRTQLAQDCISPRAYLNKLARRSMEILHEALDEGEPRIQVEAARTVIMANIKLMELEAKLMGDQPKEEQIRRALADPDDELLRALRAEREKVLALLGPETATTYPAVTGGPSEQAKK